METETINKGNHGPNVRRWREWKNINQDVLAEMIGVSQATLSLYEKKDKLERDILEKVAKALEIPVEAITELGKETSVNIFSGPSHDNSNYGIIFNPVEKLVAVYNEKEALYERMLKEKDETISLLHEVLKSK